ncbi:hypothetical protein [Roseibacillus ishigakijimensis]|uniref:Uncharacterized protein n=1 Tax=Roseibacillus ishigakijimensis TaxID=454146 RepID=A0A934VH45_9BACT|nr:hypothetical protein [Roseibacillus ishigakijimensis]MBK1833553.1 hypothetical protein [Roseibacillus ishigakijimensis]
MISVLESYLDDQITAFELDEKLQRIHSEDGMVDEVSHVLWLHYDDCRDHKVRLSKAEWDYFQRLLLVLHSDAEISSSLEFRWSWDHALAWLAWAVFIGILVNGGGGWNLLWVLPFGLVSILISVFRSRLLFNADMGGNGCLPFDSFTQIRTYRQQVPEFVKQRYRREIGQRIIRSKKEECLYEVPFYCARILGGPFVLFFQGFPSVGAPTLGLTKSC